MALRFGILLSQLAYPMQRQVIHHEETRSLGSASGKQVPLGGRQVRAGVLMKCESMCWSQFS